MMTKQNKTKLNLIIFTLLLEKPKLKQKRTEQADKTIEIYIFK